MTIMTLNHKVFPSGAPLPPNATDTIPVGPGQVTLEAEQTVIEGRGSYGFLFWNADATIYVQPSATFAIAEGQPDFEATAWYSPQGSGLLHGIVAHAFSATENQVLPDSPFAKVSPASAQTKPDFASSAQGPVTVEAASVLPTNELFHEWQQFGGAGTISGISRQALSVAQNQSSIAIAFFAVMPAECQDAYDAYVNNDCVDAPPGQYRDCVESLRDEWCACLAKHGLHCPGLA